MAYDRVGDINSTTYTFICASFQVLDAFGTLFDMVTCGLNVK